ncbi:hypothetical protein [Xanthomonas dyei]|uniref:hypothetical protein n=1 Tax=Xanthomonas dyei TaxID=743699 RepID=UPI001E65824E|nr:hypothetical protein [Xanthomonas dyei]MCC4632799.1 hypothetical protein [Xanthomonas dyei pv. eucalypti]
MKGKCRDLIAEAEHLKAHKRGFYLDAERWKEFQSPIELTWSRLRFSEDNRSNIPKERGLYAFTLSHEPSGFPDHGFIMYIGITGDISKANLRSRYSQYLANLRRGDGRPKVHGMLKRWNGHLFFNFVPIPDKKISLTEIEDELLAAVIPPINETYIKAGLQAILKDAW